MSSAATVVVVQSDDLAAWVGAISGLAGVVLGAGIDARRRGRTGRKQMRRDLIRAGARLGNASAAYRRAASAAGTAQNEPQWRALLDAHLAEMGAAAFTINETGIPEVTQASLAIVSSVFSAPDPSAPEGTTELVLAQADAIKAYNDAVRRAKL
jgi:hypothetical protein